MEKVGTEKVVVAVVVHCVQKESVRGGVDAVIIVFDNGRTEIDVHPSLRQHPKVVLIFTPGNARR